jgi:cytochrome c oxidase subunit II
VEAHMTAAIGARRERVPLSAMGKTTVAATLAVALILIVDIAIIIGEFLPPLAVFAAAGLIVAAVVATGRRWAPALASLYGALLLLAYSGFIGEELHWPTSFMFQTTMLITGVAVIALVAGVATTVQNYRSAPAARHMPGWFAAFVAAVLGVSAGLILLAGVPRLGVYGDASPAALAAMTSITTRDNAFDDAELHARVGETVALRFVNAGRAPHSFDIDELDIHAPIEPAGAGVAIFTPTEPGTYTFYCYLHTDPVTHRGMEGRLIVER